MTSDNTVVETTYGPVRGVDNGRVKVWLKPDVERWAAEQAESGRSRPARRVGG